MKTLITIILTTLFLTFFASSALAEKTGYCKTFSISPVGHSEPNNLTLFTVSLNTRFVLQRLYISGYSSRWSLIANSNFSIFGDCKNRLDTYEFPDGCAVFNAEDDLVFSYIPSSIYELTPTIIGYFEDTVPAKASADINGDGKVNMLDFVILSDQWLNGV